MKKMGFPRVWIDCVWRLISNCWFNIMINGRVNGFFKSTQGLRQGDPLSPGLFILAVDALSRSLKDLFNVQDFKPIKMPKSGPNINHLSFADDIGLFCSGDKVLLIFFLKD